jgi:hypothetical protein
MNRNITMVAVATLVAIMALLVCSTVWAQDNRQVWLGNSLLLRVRTAAGGYTIEQRVEAIQRRANALLEKGMSIPKVAVRKSGASANIYAGNTLFMTVTPADGRTNGTTSMKLANIWAGRLRDILPRITMDKPDVGRPGQVGAPGNAR